MCVKAALNVLKYVGIIQFNLLLRTLYLCGYVSIKEQTTSSHMFKRD